MDISDVLTLIGGKLAGLLTDLGIAPEHQIRIFERLYRVDKLKGVTSLVRLHLFSFVDITFKRS